jgi:ferritin-like metal-binding protein YciE
MMKNNIGDVGGRARAIGDSATTKHLERALQQEIAQRQLSTRHIEHAIAPAAQPSSANSAPKPSSSDTKK